jgi:hypothetical protein
MSYHLLKQYIQKRGIRGSGEGNLYGQVSKLSPINSLNLFLEFAYTFQIRVN